MFKAVRIAILLFILFFVAVGTWLTQSRSTDWNNSLWVKVYPINADGSDAVERYIAGLEVDDFTDIEEFVARETARYGRKVVQPLRMELGRQVREQPPSMGPEAGVLDVMLWSLKMRWWASTTIRTPCRCRQHCSRPHWNGWSNRGGTWMRRHRQCMSATRPLWTLAGTTKTFAKP